MVEAWLSSGWSDINTADPKRQEFVDSVRFIGESRRGASLFGPVPREGACWWRQRTLRYIGVKLLPCCREGTRSDDEGEEDAGAARCAKAGSSAHRAQSEPLQFSFSL